MARSIFSGKGSFMGLMKQHPEVVPVVAVVGIGCGMAFAYLGRLASRPDVVWTPGKNDMPWTRVSQSTQLHFTPFAATKKADGTPIFSAHTDPSDLRGKL